MLARELTPKRWPLPAVESTSVIVTLRAFAGEVAMEGRGPERAGPAPRSPLRAVDKRARRASFWRMVMLIRKHRVVAHTLERAFEREDLAIRDPFLALSSVLQQLRELS